MTQQIEGRTPEQMAADYHKFRGKCYEMSKALVDADPTLTLVRGHYFDPAFGREPHWWVTKPDGTIIDPTALQYPSAGTGTYEPFNGMCECYECGKEVPEAEAIILGNGHYAACSDRCAFAIVGL